MSLFAGDGSSASPDSAEQLKDVLTIIRCKVSIFMIGRLPRLQSWWSHNCGGFIWIAWLPEDTALCVDIIIIRNNIRVASLSVSAPALALNRVSEVAPGPISGGEWSRGVMSRDKARDTALRVTWHMSHCPRYLGPIWPGYHARSLIDCDGRSEAVVVVGICVRAVSQLISSPHPDPCLITQLVHLNHPPRTKDTELSSA